MLLTYVFAIILCISPILSPVWARSTTPVICDVNANNPTHADGGTTTLHTLILSSSTVIPGGTISVTLTGTVLGFLLHANDGTARHRGQFTTIANTAICTGATLPANSDTSSTIGHASNNAKPNQVFTWRAPTTEGTYTFNAIVTRQAGVSPTLRLAPVTVTVRAQIATQPPPVATQPPPTTTNRPPATGPSITPGSPPVIIVDPNNPDVVIIDTSTDPPTTPPTDPSTPTNPATPPPSTPTNPPTIDINTPIPQATLAQHATRNDCWTSLNNNVYDITKLITTHSGGNVIVQFCGKDSTAVFAPNHNNVAADLAILEANYRIGVLSNGGGDANAPGNNGNNNNPGTTSSAASSPSSKGGLSDNVFIGIIAGGLLALIVVIGGFIYYQKSKKTYVTPRV